MKKLSAFFCFCNLYILSQLGGKVCGGGEGGRVKHKNIHPCLSLNDDSKQGLKIKLSYEVHSVQVLLVTSYSNLYTLIN